MPLHSFELENFKCYASRTEVRLGAVTLLFGANSVGKSTLIQALLALAQSATGSEVPSRLVASGEWVDLGRFSNLRHAGVDEDAPVTLGVRVSESTGIRLAFVGGELDAAQLRVSDGQWWTWNVLRDRDPTTLAPAVEGVDFVGASAQRVAWLRRLMSMGDEEGGGSTHRVHIEVEVRPDHSRVDLVVDGPLDPADAEFVAREGNRRFSIPSDGRLESEAEEVAYNSRGPSVVESVGALWRSRSAEISGLQGLLFPIGPARTYGLRVERADETRTDRWVGLAGERLMQVLHDHPEVLPRVNGWLRDLRVPYELEQVVSGQAVTTLELLLQSQREPKHRVGLPDVGFGIGQILPVLVQMAVLDEGLVTIEQPEIHLHPAMQARLARVLVDWVRPAEGESPGRRKVLIETHSEHLVLGLQGLFRVGEAPLPASDLTVYAVTLKRTDDRMEEPDLRCIELDEDGTFLDPWPGGFFPEREQLLESGGVDR